MSSVVKSKVSRIGLFLANPMVAKINKIEEHDNTEATANGITIKTIFLLLLTAVGVILFFLTSKMIPNSYVEKVEGIEVNMIEAAIAFGGMVIALTFPYIAYKFVKASMVLGSIYSLIQGYFLAFLFHFVGPEFVYPAFYALGLTALVVITMIFLYRLKLIKLNHKIISVIITSTTLFIILGLVYFILNSIPMFQEFTSYLQSNMVVYAIVSLVGISLSSLFLLVDLEVLHHCVADKLPKKYEWLAAFALSFAIIELYLKIFNFVIRFMNKNQEKNN